MGGDHRTCNAMVGRITGGGAPSKVCLWLGLALLLWTTLAAPPAAALGRDQVVQVPGINLQELHRRLSQGGFLPGPYNPEDLSEMAQALKRLQRARGLPVTGRLDAATWAALGAGKKPPTTPPRTPDANGPQWPAGLVAALQGWLRELGYQIVKPNGVLDPATQAALRAFRQKEKLPAATGLDAATYLQVVDRRYQRGCNFAITLLAAGANPEAVGGEGQFTAKVKAAHAREAYLKLLALALVHQGFKAPVKGRLDAGLTKALLLFQAAHKLKASGRPDAITVATLFNLACAEGCRFEIRLAPQGTTGPGPVVDPGDLSVVRKLDPSLSKLRRPVAAGDPVLAIEKLQCSRHSGHWILYYRGVVTGVDSGQVRVKVSGRYGYRYRADARGINTKDWWCIPHSRHCYSPVKFNAWGGRARASDVLVFPAQGVFNQDIGVINAMMIYMSQQCKE